VAEAAAFAIFQSPPKSSNEEVMRLIMQVFPTLGRKRFVEAWVLVVGACKYAEERGFIMRAH
jgi:hypothetical protein